ncbi:MAG: tripartite tricarboxylate transporter TctB family protein [Sulfolobales archaeon]
MKGEIIIFLSLLIISSYFLHLAFQLPKIPWLTIGSEVWPSILLSGIITTCTAALIYRAVKKNYYVPPKIKREGALRVVGTVIFILVYAFVFEYLGYFITTLVLFSIYLKFLKVRAAISVLVALIFALLATVMFPVGLLIPLPRGVGVFYDFTSYVLSLFGR